MTHILVAGKLHSVGVEKLNSLRNRGLKVTYIEEVDEPSYAKHIQTADALIIRTQPLSAATINKAKNLKVVSRHGVGYDAIDLRALNARGIPLTIVSDVNSVSVAEQAMMQLLAGAKQVIRADKAVRDPTKWDWRNQLQQREISEKNLLIIGYGRAGRKLARMAAGFYMNIRVFDPYLQSHNLTGEPVKFIETLSEGLFWADCISLHVPPGTTPLLGENEFAEMKPGMIIANTARGGVICERSLSSALKTGQVHAAGVDVFETEPPSIDTAHLYPDNAILSPHIAGLTEEASERMAISCIENALGVLDRTIDPDLVVNKEVFN